MHRSLSEKTTKMIMISPRNLCNVYLRSLFYSFSFFQIPIGSSKVKEEINWTEQTRRGGDLRDSLIGLLCLWQMREFLSRLPFITSFGRESRGNVLPSISY
jgi:hypothetical protein